MEKHRRGRSRMRSIRQSSLHKLEALCTKQAGYVRTGTTNKRLELHRKDDACPWQGTEGAGSARANGPSCHGQRSVVNAPPTPKVQ